MLAGMSGNDPRADARPLAIAILGPTASGKTAFAATWCERLGTRVVSVDSALVYRGLDIGSAKPDEATLARAPHDLVDIREPHEPYSAAEFASDALRAMRQLEAQGRIPLLVGGTGLYFRALFEGLAEMPESDPAWRASLVAEMQERGLPGLHAELARVDPVAAARIHATDPQRILRALEVWRRTGIPITEWQARAQRGPAFPFRVLKLVLAPPDRAILHERIARRFHAMVEQGLLAEVEGLMADPRLHPDLPGMRAVGYRQAWRHLSGLTTRDAFIEEGIAATRQLAKRQLTWLRGDPSLRWFDPDTHQAELDLAMQGFLGRGNCRQALG